MRIVGDRERESFIIILNCALGVGGPDLRAVNVVNGDGLDSALDPPGHAATCSAGYHWETMYYQSSASITFDLEGTYDVGSLRVWNFTHSI